MSVSIRLPSKGESLEVGTPIALFQTKRAWAVNVQRQQYVLSPDDQRFLMNTVLGENRHSTRYRHLEFEIQILNAIPAGDACLDKFKSVL
jgi:hypothetical protein